MEYKKQPDPAVGRLTVVFDFDGTLHETLPLYTAAFRAEQQRLRGIGWPSREYADGEIALWLGMNEADMWQDFYPSLPEPLRKKSAENIVRNLVEGFEAGRSRLYPGMEDTLNTLAAAGCSMAVLSNCGRPYMNGAVRAFGLSRWFGAGCTFCSGDFPGRSKAEIFPEVTRILPGPYVMLGDRSSDLAVGRANGIPFIACTYGYGHPEELAEADGFLQKPADLPELLGTMGLLTL